jgi:hypothetical protein
VGIYDSLCLSAMHIMMIMARFLKSQFGSR